LNVDAIFIFDAYWAAAPPPSSVAQLRAICQPIIATAVTRSVGIGCRLPVPDTLRIHKRSKTRNRAKKNPDQVVKNPAVVSLLKWGGNGQCWGGCGCPNSQQTANLHPSLPAARCSRHGVSRHVTTWP